MAIPLKIKNLEWANFLSYGDYTTTIDLQSLGPTLIIGQRDGVPDLKNGTGKSSICMAIIWCLFGRIPLKASPGDKVINWNTKQACYVRITTTDGWIITRTRQMNNHDDLLISKDGIDVTISTNSNAQQYLNNLFGLDFEIFSASMFLGQNAQSFLELSDQKRKGVLERLLGLHRLNIWGDIANDKRQSVELEQQKIAAVINAKIDNLKRLNLQLSSVDEKSVKFNDDIQLKIKEYEKLLSKFNYELSSLVLPDINDIKLKYEKYQINIKKLNELNVKISQCEMTLMHLDKSIQQSRSIVKQHLERLSSLNIVDIDKLRNAHTVADDIEYKSLLLQNKLSELSLKHSELQIKYNSVSDIIKDWNDKAGKECPACKQVVSEIHTSDLCQPYKFQIESLNSDIFKSSRRMDLIRNEINGLSVDRPKLSVEVVMRDNAEAIGLQNNIKTLTEEIDYQMGQHDKLSCIISRMKTNYESLRSSEDSDIEHKYLAAQNICDRYDLLSAKINDIKNQIEHELQKQNPYHYLSESLTNEIKNLNDELSNDKLKIEKFNEQIKQLDYIRRSYHDRNKIKMFILADLIPYFNQRIGYYLDALDCDLQLKFTSTLSIETSKWDYEFHSGGQQKRIDLAIMFALYDLYISIYGRQCNIMVLDEVDGSLDPHGVRAFVDIILNDFANERPDKPDTILIISHKTEMVDQFPNQIIVNQDQSGYSHIVN